MALKTFKPFTGGRRHMVANKFDAITKKYPEKKLTVSKIQCRK